MSRKRPELANTKAAVEKMAKSLRAMPGVKSVLVKGSRSPRTKKDPRPDSDWDLEAVVEDMTVFLPSPRDAYKVHADLHRVLEPNTNAVPISRALTTR